MNCFNPDKIIKQEVINVDNENIEQLHGFYYGMTYVIRYIFWYAVNAQITARKCTM